MVADEKQSSKVKSRHLHSPSLTILIAVVRAVVEKSDVGVRLAGHYFQKILMNEWGKLAPLVVTATGVVVVVTMDTRRPTTHIRY